MNKSRTDVSIKRATHAFPPRILDRIPHPGVARLLEGGQHKIHKVESVSAAVSSESTTAMLLVEEG